MNVGCLTLWGDALAKVRTLPLLLECSLIGGKRFGLGGRGGRFVVIGWGSDRLCLGSVSGVGA